MVPPQQQHKATGLLSCSDMPTPSLARSTLKTEEPARGAFTILWRFLPFHTHARSGADRVMGAPEVPTTRCYSPAEVCHAMRNSAARLFLRRAASRSRERITQLCICRFSLGIGCHFGCIFYFFSLSPAIRSLSPLFRARLVPDPTWARHHAEYVP